MKDDKIVTKNDIEYKVAGSLFKTTIPAGTKCIPATNLPDYELHEKYWAEPWEGMSEEEQSWHRNYGFLLQGGEFGDDEFSHG